MFTQLIPRESLGGQGVEGRADVLRHHGIWQCTVDRSPHLHLQVGYADLGFSLEQEGLGNYIQLVVVVVVVGGGVP